MILFFVGVQIFFLLARNNLEISREAWSLFFRLLFVTWLVKIALRGEESCKTSDMERPLFMSFIPLPKLPLVTPGYGTNLCLPKDVALFPQTQLAFYVAELVWLLRIPTALERKDDSVMIAHHIITSIIILGAIYVQFYWPVSFVLVLHDISDLFVDGAKFLRAQGKTINTTSRFGSYCSSACAQLSSALFYGFVFVWFATRVYYIPVNVAWYLWQTRLEHGYTFVHYFSFSVFMLVQIPQLIWTGIIVKVATKSLFGEIKDDRE